MHLKVDLRRDPYPTVIHEHPTDVISLDLRASGLTELPEWLGGLTGLTYLDLSSNGLAVLPEWLGRLIRARSGTAQ